jgi:hypothetical protein
MALTKWKNRSVAPEDRPSVIRQMMQSDKWEDNPVGDAARNKVNLSVWLEEEDPTEAWVQRDPSHRLDAFGRQVREQGIVTIDDPVTGQYSSPFDVFFKDQSARSLVLEWCARRSREVRYGRPINPRSVTPTFNMAEGPYKGRNIALSSDDGLGTIWRPYFDAAAERATRVQAPIPLSRLVGLTTPINGDAYRAAYMLDPAPEDVRKYRVGESAEIPIARIVEAEQFVRAYKYGRGFEVSYELLRRQRISKVAYWIARAALQEELDRVTQGVDTLVNGDGNANGATVYPLTSLHTGTPLGTLTLQAWLAFKSKFSNEYAMTVALMREADWIDIQMLTAGNNYTTLAMLGPTFGGFTQINDSLSETVALGKLDTVTVDTIIGIDTTGALEHFIEIGSNITESEQFITRQTQVVVMTTTEGFAVLDKKATRVLNLAA